MIHRRHFLGGLALLPLGAVHRVAGASAAVTETLADLARRKGLFFGSAVTREQVTATDAYQTLLVEQCDVWTTEWEMKWGVIEPARGERSYEAVDDILAAGLPSGKRIRGHTLLWHEHLPEWFGPALTPADWSTHVEPYVVETVRRYDGRLFHLDVVNEPVEPDDGHRHGLRVSPFFQLRGADYIAQAFEIAHRVSPSTKLYLNEYGLCKDVPWQEARRVAMLRLLERLVAAGTPVHGLGIQAHLDAEYGFDERAFDRFLRDCADLGLELTVTELDVIEAQPHESSLAARDRKAADEVRQVLAVALDQPAFKGVVTWGLSDRVSWLRTVRNLDDNRGLPFDEDLQPTPMYQALADLFRNAPERPK